MNQPNQPPKSAEELIEQARQELRDKGFKGHANHSLVPRWMAEFAIAYASQFALYVTDEEIDAMWPYDNTELNRVVLLQRQAAKAMRDMIFNNVKLKV